MKSAVSKGRTTFQGDALPEQRLSEQYLRAGAQRAIGRADAHPLQQARDIGGHGRRLHRPKPATLAKRRDHRAEEMDDSRRLEREKHAGIELLRSDDALELPAGGGEPSVVAPRGHDDLLDQATRRVQIAPDEMGLERRRQHPIAIGRTILVDAGDPRRENIENLAGEPAGSLGVARRIGPSLAALMAG